MIKFKKILEKAAEQSAKSGAGVALMSGAPHASRGGRPAEEVAEAAQTVAEPELAATAPIEEIPVLEEAIGAETTGQPQLPQAESPPPETPEEGVVSEELVASVLSEMFPESSRAPQTPVAAAAEQKVLEAPSAPEQPAEASGAAGEQSAVKARRPLDVESLIEGMVGEAFAAIEKEKERVEKPTTEQSDQAAAQDDAHAEAGGEEDRTDLSRAIDDDFMAEVDKLLNEFGQLGAKAGEGEAEPSETPAEAVLSAQDSVETAPETEEDETHEDPGVRGEPAAEMEEPPTGASTQVPPDDAFVDASFESSGQPGDLLSPAEKEALMAEDEVGQPSVSAEAAAEAVQRDLEKLEQESSRDEDASRSQADEAEVELDFSPAAVGIEEGHQQEKDASAQTEDLLAKVLADLDKLGDVPKPSKEGPIEEPEPEPDHVEDFSEILKELNSENLVPSQPSSTIAALDAAREAIDVSAAALTEEDVLNDAVSAVNEDSASQEKRPEDGGASSQRGGSKEKARESGASVAANSGRSREEPDRPQPRDAAEDKVAGGRSGVAKPSDDTSGAGEHADPNEGPADGSQWEEPVEDENVLLASLEASMDSVPEKAHESPAKAPEPKESAQDDEEIVRQQLLSRTREVEQKVLDDVFGERSKDFKATLKADMANMDSASPGRSEKSSALAAEAARRSPGARPGADSLSGEAAPPDTAQAAALQRQWSLYRLAYRINRPFLKWLDSETLRLLGALSLALLAIAFVWLAASLAKLWFNL